MLTNNWQDYGDILLDNTSGKQLVEYIMGKDIHLYVPEAYHPKYKVNWKFMLTGYELSRRNDTIANMKVIGSYPVGILVDGEIVLSTRYGMVMVFINKTLSTETSYQQDLINRDLLSTRLIVGKVGSGMWCEKFNSTSNLLVCETQRKVNMYGCVSE